MKEVYLVDCENVGFPTFVGVSDFKVYYFVNDKAKSIQIATAPLHFDVIHCSHSGGKNALDFILDVHLGFILKEFGKNCSYYIVSNDKGYDDVVTHCKSLGYRVARLEHHLGSLAISDTSLIQAMPDKVYKKVCNIYRDFKRSRKKNIKTLNKQLRQCLTKYGYKDFEVKIIASELERWLMNIGR